MAVTAAGPGSVRLEIVQPAEVAASLAIALAGGPPIAPLPADPVEQARAITMFQPAQPVTEDDAAVVVATSGSTGAPKGVVLSRAAIRASVAAMRDRLGGAGDWALALPAHYIAGLMVLARAHLAGTRAVAGAFRSEQPAAGSRHAVAAALHLVGPGTAGQRRCVVAT